MKEVVFVRKILLFIDDDYRDSTNAHILRDLISQLKVVNRHNVLISPHVTMVRLLQLHPQTFQSETPTFLTNKI